MIKINTELYKKFEESNLPCQYSFKDIERILKEKYSAVEYGMDIYKQQEPELYEKELAKNDLPFKCFKIEDKSVLDKLYNEEEKKWHKEVMEGHPDEDMSPEEAMNYNIKIKEDNSPPSIMWQKIEEGKLINILLYGSEQEGVTGFTVQGLCNKVAKEMFVLGGIDPKYCVPGNSYFDEYIELLEKMGYI